ncbi:MAG TPA: hypothetical protein ENH47_00950 [Ignavibacteriales bacterium]|nr:hypothetical protein [Ignavibacteriales bacterium]
MALQTIKGGLWIPEYLNRAITSPLSPKLLDTAGYKFAAIFKVPKTGTISKVGFRVGNVTTPETLKVGLQTLSGGDPTGTAYGGMVAGTQATPAANTYYTVPLGTPATATVNDTVAVVIEFDSAVGNLEIDYLSTNAQGFPYIDYYTGAWVKDDNIPAISLEYSDGSYENTGMFPISNVSTFKFNNTDTPDERALRFSLPFPGRIAGFWVGIDNNRTGAFDIVLYEGTTAKATVSFAAIEYSSVDMEICFGVFDTPFEYTKNTEYFLAVKPTSATDIGLREITILSAAIMDSFPGGTNFYLGTRTDAGSWSTDTLKRPFMGVFIDQLDDGVGGAGGMIVHPGMDGGMRG